MSICFSHFHFDRGFDPIKNKNERQIAYLLIHIATGYISLHFLLANGQSLPRDLVDIGDGVLLFPNVNQVTEEFIIEYLTTINNSVAFEIKFNKLFKMLNRYTKENTFAGQKMGLDQDKKEKFNCIYREDVRNSIR